MIAPSACSRCGAAVFVYPWATSTVVVCETCARGRPCPGCHGLGQGGPVRLHMTSPASRQATVEYARCVTCGGSGKVAAS